jgi:spore coat protein A, manganese oxidase
LAPSFPTVADPRDRVNLGAMKRRSFIAGSLATGASLWLPRRPRADDNPWSGSLDAYKVRPPAFSTPMPRLPDLAPVAPDVYEMTIRAGTAQPLSGPVTRIVGAEGRWPGPTIRATRGRPIRLRVRNLLEESTNLHNHGHHSSAANDGHPFDVIRAGAVREYQFPNDQPGGTGWYHDHAMGLTGAHVYRGLAGFYLIHDPAEDALGLPSGEHDLPVCVQDRMFDAGNALVYTVDAGAIFKGFLGNTLCVNGVHTPYLEVGARKLRFRFLNGSNARNLRLALDDGQPLIQIASDGHLLPAPVAQAAVELAPGERADCVIDFSRYAVGATPHLRNLDRTWPELPDVMRFVVARKEPDASRIPDTLGEAPRLDLRRAVQRRVSLEISDGKWTMNRLRFDPARIDFRPRLGSVEVWTIKNAENTQMHPFHQHLVPFQVLDVDGAAPPPALRGWKDTVAVGPSQTVRIAMRFSGEPGVYVFHCHKLEHEDHAMMLQQQVS